MSAREQPRKMKREQHVVPEFYLKGFTDESRVIWALDKVTSKVIGPVNTNYVGWRKHFYTIPAESAPQGDPMFLEDAFCRGERAWAAALHPLLDDLHQRKKGKNAYQRVLIHRRDRLTLAHFYMAQWFRATWGRDFILDQDTDWSNVPPAWAHGSFLAHVEESESSDRLSQQIWVFGINEDYRSHPLYASDEPVMIQLLHEEGADMPEDGGPTFPPRGSVYSIPLSKALVLRIHERSYFSQLQERETGRKFMELDGCGARIGRDEVEHYRRIQLRRGVRHVFSPLNDFPHAPYSSGEHRPRGNG